MRAEFLRFEIDSAAWLAPYTLFRVLIDVHGGHAVWERWPSYCRNLPDAERWLSLPSNSHLCSERDFYAYVQWIAWRQWRAVRAYAEQSNVFLMGEMSFGVGRHSVDVWAQPHLFDLSGSMGTPPISYFETNRDSERWGQNWGLPPYCWARHRASDFSWLRSHIAAEQQYFHVCRLDHLRGYFRAYVFPWEGGQTHREFAGLSEAEARNKTGGRLPAFVPGDDRDPVAAAINERQGREIIGVLQQAAGDMMLVAEIMGQMPDYMRQALDDLALANLAFPQLERCADRSLRDRSSFRYLSVVSYGNHDHAPIAVWYGRLAREAKQNPRGQQATDLTHLMRFIDWHGAVPDALTDELLAALQRTLLQTSSAVAVLMSSDLLGIAQRFNLPGTYGDDTWCDRLAESLDEYASSPVFGPRIARVQALIDASGRSVRATAAALHVASLDPVDSPGADTER